MTETLIITDSPESLAGLGGLIPQTPWIPIALSDWGDDTKRAWQAVGGAADAAPVTASSLVPWRQIMAVGRSPVSQVDGLRELLQSGQAPPSPFACLAFTGDGFHGNRGRPWQALEGNLHLTVLFSPNRPARELGVGLSIVPTLAVADALGQFDALGQAIKIKWVNDVLLDGKKVSGVITSTLAKGELIEHAILGIGVNIAATPTLQPGRFVQPPVCLREAAPDALITLPVFLPVLLERLAKRHEQLLTGGPGPLLRDYTALSCVIGREVEIWEETAGETDSPKLITKGMVEAIHEDLALALEGQAEQVHRGRLVFAD